MGAEVQSDGFEPFGQFLLLRPLGKGGMGIVYIARTNSAEFPLAAVKRLRPDAVDVPTFAERFAHEGALALRLSHPNLVETLDVGEHRGVQYVASAFIAGKDLGMVADRLAEIGGGAPLAAAVRMLLDALAGLAYVHNARERDGRRLHLVHRDITPGNLLLGYDGTTRIADFGLAKSALTEHMLLTEEGMILGTPRYLPPEVVLGKKAGTAADIYGLGAVIYRVLTTLPPFEGGAREVVAKILNGRPLPLVELRPDLPSWFTSFLGEMMEPDAAKRPAQAAPLARRLQALAETYGVLVGHDEVSRWIVDLFRDEHAVESQELRELLKIEAARVGAGAGNPGERTRVLRRPTERIVAREADDGERTEASPQGLASFAPTEGGLDPGGNMDTDRSPSPAARVRANRVEDAPTRPDNALGEDAPTARGRTPVVEGGRLEAVGVRARSVGGEELRGEVAPGTAGTAGTAGARGRSVGSAGAGREISTPIPRVVPVVTRVERAPSVEVRDARIEDPGDRIGDRVVDVHLDPRLSPAPPTERSSPHPPAPSFIAARAPTSVGAGSAAPSLSWRVIALMVAIGLAASIAGLVAGAYLIQGPGVPAVAADEQRWKLFERIGAVQRELDARRAAGTALSPELDGDIEKVRAAAREGRWREAQVRLRELELALERNSAVR